MMRARRAWGAAAFLACALVPACGGGDGDAAPATTTTIAPGTTTSSTTTSTTERTTTTKPEPADPWAVPDDIDEAYVERVLTKLYAIEGDARRIAVREGLVTEEVLDLLNSVYEPGHATFVINSFAAGAQTSFEGVRRPPGDVRPNVVAVDGASEDCVVARTKNDFRKVAISPPEPTLTFVALTRHERNVTGWVVQSAGRSGSGGVPEDSCVP